MLVPYKQLANSFCKEIREAAAKFAPDDYGGVIDLRTVYHYLRFEGCAEYAQHPAYTLVNEYAPGFGAFWLKYLQTYLRKSLKLTEATKGQLKALRKAIVWPVAPERLKDNATFEETFAYCRAYEAHSAEAKVCWEYESWLECLELGKDQARGLSKYVKQIAIHKFMEQEPEHE